jgi:hypothetical protein
VASELFELEKADIMTIKNFVAEFDAEDFPSQYGRWRKFEDHDPPFSHPQLRKMQQCGVIELDADKPRFRLTLKAATYRKDIA